MQLFGGSEISQEIKNKVDSAINDNHIVVFSKTYCPYCTNTKTLLKKLGQEFELFELDLLEDGAQIQSYLYELTGQRTVPNVFIDKKHIGGDSDLQSKYRSGELTKLLQ